ncbi:hypothetical protein OSTOST_03544, partial [Ostertagia ostertagi]
MATSLKARKGVLTRHSNNLSRSLDRYSTLGDEANLEDRETCRAVLAEIQIAEVEIKALQGTFENALFAFTDAIDNLKDPLTEDEEGKVSEYIDNAQDLIDKSASLLLEHWTSKTTHLKDQRKLHDQLSAITTQLVSKGESLDSPWLLSKILSKFTENIQRNTLKEKVSLPPHERWTLTKLMTTFGCCHKTGRRD